MKYWLFKASYAIPSAIILYNKGMNEPQALQEELLNLYYSLWQLNKILFVEEYLIEENKDIKSFFSIT